MPMRRTIDGITFTHDVADPFWAALKRSNLGVGDVFKVFDVMGEAFVTTVQGASIRTKTPFDQVRIHSFLIDFDGTGTLVSLFSLEKIEPSLTSAYRARVASTGVLTHESTRTPEEVLEMVRLRSPIIAGRLEKNSPYFSPRRNGPSRRVRGDNNFHPWRPDVGTIIDQMRTQQNQDPL
jgi:hypothetical protein